MAIGVAVYRLIDLNEHGYWVPLTILFVMRPAHAETDLRVELRAIGTLVGLIFATALAELVGGGGPEGSGRTPAALPRGRRRLPGRLRGRVDHLAGRRRAVGVQLRR